MNKIKKLSLLWLLLYSANSFAQDTESEEESLDDLMALDVEVTTLARKAQKISKSAAAIYVLKGKDIMRSGARSIPEALRYVPGLNVAKIDGHSWSVSARGFMGQFANKLLVMIDGRSVYTPLFGGVYWETLDVMMQDIDRIEIIRGPGSSLWGANAVNGIIHIITKKAQDTQGGLIYAGVGTYEKEFGGIRYGGQIGPESYYRGYFKYLNKDAMDEQPNHDAKDDFQSWSLGGRFDFAPTPDDKIMFDFQMFNTKQDQIRTEDRYKLNLDGFLGFTPIVSTEQYFVDTPETVHFKGGHLLGKWTHEISDTSSFSLQSFYDYTHRESIDAKWDQGIFDLDFQHAVEFTEQNNFLWGVGYRNIQIDVTNTKYQKLKDNHQSLNLYSAFLQDNIELIDDLLTFTIGSKIEFNEYTGFEFQPSARLTLTPTERHTIWTSVSRAVRTPTLIERDGWLLLREGQANPNAAPLPNGLPAPPNITMDTNDSFKSEDVIAYEMGYRQQITDYLSADIAIFYNKYSNLRTLNQTGTTIFPRNDMKATVYGLEFATEYKAFDWWKLKAGYSYTHIDVSRQKHNLYMGTEDTDETATPRHQAFLQSFMDLSDTVQFDLGFRYVSGIKGELGNAGLYDWNIPAYFTMDARIGWQPVENLDISLIGKNLLDNHHPEYSSSFVPIQATEVPRSVMLEVTYSF